MAGALLPPRRLLSLTVMIAMLCLCAAASAVALNGVDTNDLSVGSASVLECDPDGVTISQVTSGTTVTHLDISDIDVACAGGDLTVTLAAADGSAVATAGPVALAGATVTVAVSPTPDLGDYSRHHLHVVGP